MNELLDNFFRGSVSSAISKTLTAPIELWRIQRQNPFIPNSTLKDVIKKEGIRYLWKGNYVNLVKGTPQYTLNYMIFKEINKSHENKLISGAVSGCVSMALIYPLETTRSYLSLQMNKTKYKGITHVLRKTPIRRLYGGLGTSIIGFGSFSGLLFYFQDKIKKHNTQYPFINGGLASVMSLTITYPTDLLRRRLQLQDYDPSVPKYNGVADAIKKIYHIEGGVPAFYRGLHANYVKSFAQWSIYFYIIDNMKMR
jgi:solute carrier family 25 (mitochondrial phosphate transporter), member 23/24/25/41